MNTNTNITPRYVVMLAVCVVVGSAWAQMAPQPLGPVDSMGAPYVPGEVLVVFEPHVRKAAVEQSLTATGARVFKHFEHVDVYHVSTAPGKTVLETVALLEQDPSVKGASPNYIGSGAAHLTAPNDPFFLQQWHLKNSGQHIPALKHTDPNGNGAFDPGESVYDDVDESGDVTVPPDVLLAGPGAAPGTALVRLYGQWNVRYVDANHNGRYDAGECIYRDVDDSWRVSARVSAGDIRLTPCPPHGGAGTPVVGVDGDVGDPLTVFVIGGTGVIDADIDAPQAWDHLTDCSNEVVAVIDSGIDVGHPDFAGNIWVNAGETAGNGRDDDDSGAVDDVNGADFINDVRHTEAPPSNEQFDVGECVYQDTDGSHGVSVGDMRITACAGFAAGTVVAAGNADVGFYLIPFSEDAPNRERHNDANGNHIYDLGDAVYRDADNSGTVTAGDIRLQAAAGFGAGTVVGAADGDIGTALREVHARTGDIGDLYGHGTAVAGVIGARGDNATDACGVCWRVQLLAARAFDANNNFQYADIISAIEYVIALKTRGVNPVNVRIINLSGSGGGHSVPLRAAIAAAGANGILFVTSAGNNGINNDDDNWYAREAIYRDVDASGAVSAGDSRLTTIHIAGNTYDAGSAVAADDADVANALVAFHANERHADPNGDGAYSAGESIYWAPGAAVAVGHTRITPVVVGAAQFVPGSVVAAGDADIGTPLIAFAANERHDERHVANGLLSWFIKNYPCAFDLDNIVCVGASDVRDNLASFSAYGTTSVDLNAPGQDILTLRRREDGGGVQYISGTSFSAPIVSGIAAHFWSLPGFTTHTVAQLKERLLTGANGPLGVPHPHGVDPRWGLLGTVVSGLLNDGRARMTMGDDFGDAPDGPYPTLLINLGARHEDIGEEWLGRTLDLHPYSVPEFPPFGPPVASDVSPEFDAMDNPLWPPDPDMVGNLVDLDHHDDGIWMPGPFFFTPVGDPIKTAVVHVFVETENNGVADHDGGRYGGAHGADDGVHHFNDNKYIWVNGFFDWNSDGDWDDPDEHVFMLRADPPAWGAARGGYYRVEFNMPPAPGGVPVWTSTWARFRLDYGENCGQNLLPPLAVLLSPPSSPGGQIRFWDDPGGLPWGPGPVPNRYESVGPVNPEFLDLTRGVAQFGEVEDYPLKVCNHDGNRSEAEVRACCGPDGQCSYRTECECDSMGGVWASDPDAICAAYAPPITEFTDPFDGPCLLWDTFLNPQATGVTRGFDNGAYVVYDIRPVAEPTSLPYFQLARDISAAGGYYAEAVVAWDQTVHPGDPLDVRHREALVLTGSGGFTEAQINGNAVGAPPRPRINIDDTIVTGPALPLAGQATLRYEVQPVGGGSFLYTGQVVYEGSVVVEYGEIRGWQATRVGLRTSRSSDPAAPFTPVRWEHFSLPCSSPGDLDADGDADLDDFGLFTACLAGPGTPVVSGCDCADSDFDGDVDLVDYGAFMNAIR